MANHIPKSYMVSVFSASGQRLEALLETASKETLPNNWDCDWPYIWERTDFDCQSIIQMSVDGGLWGMMRYGLYPYPIVEPKIKPSFLFLENLEAHPARQFREIDLFRKRKPQAPTPQISPVGRWLVWYACQSALEHCDSEAEPLILLESTSNAVDYYRDVIRMTMTDANLSSFGEDSYAFTFDRNSAKAFCDSQRSEYGYPKSVAQQ